MVVCVNKSAPLKLAFGRVPCRGFIVLRAACTGGRALVSRRASLHRLKAVPRLHRTHWHGARHDT